MTPRTAARAAAATLASAVALAGCGGGSAAEEPVRAALNAYLTAVGHHDAAGACRAQTTDYWLATRAEVDAKLAARGRSALPRDCQAGFQRLFALHGTRPPTANVSLANIAIHGNSASGTILTGSRRQRTQFTRTTGGQWQISCCTGAQLTHVASATYRVPSGAMEPTLKVGQTVTSDNAAMRARPPRLDEIITFHPPSIADAPGPTCRDRHQGANTSTPCGAVSAKPSAELFIKRVVGLPGDRIAIAGGRVVRNGQVASEPFITRCSTGGAGLCNFHNPITVPPGTYYVLGDNRGASDDSRFWGPIRRAWIVGLIKTPR
jgi:signal peptidase I